MKANRLLCASSIAAGVGLAGLFSTGIAPASADDTGVSIPAGPDVININVHFPDIVVPADGTFYYPFANWCFLCGGDGGDSGDASGSGTGGAGSGTGGGGAGGGDGTATGGDGTGTGGDGTGIGISGPGGDGGNGGTISILNFVLDDKNPAVAELNAFSSHVNTMLNEINPLSASFDPVGVLNTDWSDLNLLNYLNDFDPFGGVLQPGLADLTGLGPDPADFTLLGLDPSDLTAFAPDPTFLTDLLSI